MTNIIKLATEVQAEIDGEYDQIAQAKKALEVKKSAFAKKEVALDEEEKAILAKKAELQMREEEVSRRELNVKSQEDVEAAQLEAATAQRVAQESLKKAQELNDDTKLKLEDLAKREMALTQREATYKENLKKEFVDKFMGK